MSEFPKLVRLGEAEAAIERGGHRLVVSGDGARRILGRHEHMLTHGEPEAAIYLAGVIDGLAAERLMQSERTLARLREKIDAGRELIRRAKLPLDEPDAT